ncbi:MAG TPA: ABC transporter substrate-binding protein [Xanthobacteraceae bacterium]|nr:ABC transporter substrate-binding protein [Xanthobacteraceae bacterium]
MTQEQQRSKARVSRRAVLRALGAGAAVGSLARPKDWTAAAANDPIKIGLSAAFSGPNAAAGEALQRGAELAMEDINGAGGVLGRPLSLVIRDNEHKLDRGVAQTRELIEREGCVAILGSQGSFIGLAVIDTIHELKVPWFALAVGGVGIVEHKRTPNYMFRVATNDREVAKFLVGYAQDKLGAKRLGILNEDTGWGVPAIEDLRAALKARNLDPVSVDKMKVGDADFTPQMLRAKDAEADTLLSYSNAVEMANALKAGNKIGYRPKVVGAWGLANNTFPSLAGPLADGVLVMQTFTFVQNSRPKAQALLKRFTEKYPVKDATAIPFPSYVGNCYDATHMIALAARKAGSTDGPALHAALEALGTYDGLIKTYTNPFSPERHEALGPQDYQMTVWNGPRLELIG